MALNRSPVQYLHQSCSVEGNDLNHLVEGNQAGLFECITRPYPLPPSHTKKFYIQNIKALALMVSDKKVFSCFPSISLCKTFDPKGHYWSQGYDLSKLGRGQLGEATYQISRL